MNSRNSGFVSCMVRTSGTDAVGRRHAEREIASVGGLCVHVTRFAPQGLARRLRSRRGGGRSWSTWCVFPLQEINVDRQKVSKKWLPPLIALRVQVRTRKLFLAFFGRRNIDGCFTNCNNWHCRTCRRLSYYNYIALESERELYP